MSIREILPTDATSSKMDDFSRFNITHQLLEKLRSLGDFGCEEIWYGFPPTFTLGHLDGCRWLFGARKHAGQTLFMIFAPETQSHVCWDNLDKLAMERSWEYIKPLKQAANTGVLSHEEALSAILVAARQFRKKRPFG
ncbi:hypothetical protein AAIH70_16440 [Neorhizobium sp. BT27B]|uniref:hypothetical protein n=1 Tax=Neorhizobium sp. BT27B TaxID=3142625 RepID=UPI003D2B0A2A